MKKIGNYKMTDKTLDYDDKPLDHIHEVKIYSNIKDANDDDVLDALRYAVNFYERKLNKIKEQEKV